jgi:hypothetical protein
MSSEKIKGNRPSHEPEIMVKSRTIANRWKATCKSCGGLARLSGEQGEHGTATCYGDEIVVARAPQ